MNFKFHLYIQKHRNRTYTAIALPFYNISSYGINLDEIKAEIGEAIHDRLVDIPPSRLHQFDYDSRIYLQKVQIELRPIDRKKNNKRREKVQLTFSLLVHPQEEGQLYVTVPKLGPQGPSFYVYAEDELDEQAKIELTSWLDSLSLDQLLEYQYARSETLETIEVEVDIKKGKDKSRSDSDIPLFSGRDANEDSFWALREIGINMTAQASERRFRKAYHREESISKVMNILCGARNNSVLVLGESESGKTAIVQEIVRRILNQDAPEELHGREVWLLAPDRIIAGAQFIGTWEERISDLVNECRKKQHILYVTDLPGLLEIGRWSKSDNNVAQALKPHISSGEVIIIGESSPDRLTMGERMGADFMNLFRRVEIPAMSEEETLSVLSNVARDLEREYNIRVEPSANEAAVQLSRRFLPYRAFPGKAIRLLEEAVDDLMRRNTNEPRNFESHSPSLLRRIERRGTVKRQQVLDTFSRYSGMPEFIINDKTRLELEVVEKYFLERVRGQEQAIGAMVNLIATVKAGLNDPHKPMGTFLFIGPTGVGKTHLAKTLAAYLFGDTDRLIRFDMSEYSDIDGVARLIGAFNSEGELTKQVRAQPFSVVLLDEFEKASARIYDIFLQVLGEGRLTDASGRTTFFHDTIIILTSNLGSGEGNFRGMGFGHREGIDRHELNEALVTHYRDQVERYFRPEFVNRIDQVVVFRQLDPLALRSIASREMGEILLRDGITRRNLLVEIDDAVIDLVLEKGYSPQYGARPLKREIERIIVSPMARQLAQRSTDDTELLRIEVDRETQQVLIKTVPINEAKTSVALAVGDDDSFTQRLRMDTAELVEGFAMLRRKLADWLESETIREMTNEKAILLSRTQAPDFWDDAEEARRRLSRFYFLDRLTRRLRQLYEKCEYLEDFATLVNKERDLRYQPDLANDYEELYRNVLYFEIELRTGNLPHRHQAMMLINRLGQTPNKDAKEASEWSRLVARMYLEWAEQKGYDRDIYLLEADDNSPGGMGFHHLTAGNFQDLIRRFQQRATTAEEIAILFEGSNVFGFLKGERGTHKLVNADSTKDELTRVQIFAIPDGTNLKQWLADYQRIKIEIVEGRRPAPPSEKHVIVRTYSLEKQGDRFIRDMRTGVRTVQTKKVMERGQIDPFILSYLQLEDGNIAWEDRFPPTFPF